MPFKIIVAKDDTGGIGLNNKIPWHNKEDMRRFASLTRGNGKNAVLMGRSTWESLPKGPLRDRYNLILSESSFIFSESSSFYMNICETDVGVFRNVDALLSFIESKSFEDVWIIGGEKVYNIFLEDEQLNKLVKEVYVTKITGEYGCDRFFQELNTDQYAAVDGESSEFIVYNNKNYSASTNFA